MPWNLSSTCQDLQFLRVIVHLLQCKEDRVLWKLWQTLFACLCDLQKLILTSQYTCHAVEKPFHNEYASQRLNKHHGKKTNLHKPREMVSDLPQHSYTQVYGAGWDPPKGTEQTGQVVTGAFSITYQQSWLTGGVPADWRLSSETPISPEGLEGGCGKADPCQPDLSAW